MIERKADITEIIWYTLPGGLYVLALAVSMPSLAARYTTLLIASAPVVGFSFHQVTRFLFEESPYGYHGKKRPIVRYLRAKFRLREYRDAANIWHLTFHGPGFPETLRDHDRRMWHFILSLWTFAAAALVGCATLSICRWSTWTSLLRVRTVCLVDRCNSHALLSSTLSWHRRTDDLPLAVLEIALACVLAGLGSFCLGLGCKSYWTIGGEEIALVRESEGYFRKIAESFPSQQTKSTSS